MKRKRKNRLLAQSLLEYSALAACFVAAALATQVYLKRGIQGYIKRSVDTVSNGVQFSPALSNYTQVSKSHSRTEELSGGDIVLDEKGKEWVHLTSNGEQDSTLLEPEVSQSGGFTDDFSDRKLTEEGLFDD